LARRYENVERWMKGARRTSATHTKQDGFPVVFVSFMGAVGVILVVGVWMARAA
jgi:hypothetical protein